jgi:hypothetical protein
MTCLFADAATPNANTVWLVILAISALGGNLATIGLWQSSRRKQETQISPQPFLVAMEKEFTTRREFETHVAANSQDHRDMFSKIGGVDRGATSKISSEVSGIHTRINSIEKSVGGLETATELQNQRLAQMDTKLDRIIERRVS